MLPFDDGAVTLIVRVRDPAMGMDPCVQVTTLGV
jgi:hypothetical protein